MHISISKFYRIRIPNSAANPKIQGMFIVQFFSICTLAVFPAYSLSLFRFVQFSMSD